VARDGSGRVRYDAQPTCSDDGTPIKVDYLAGGTVALSMSYSFQDGRLAERVSRYKSPEDPGPLRLVLKRDDRGVVTEVGWDRMADGSIEQTDSYDLSCWVVKSDRVSYQKAAK